ncbi:MAG: helix-turn-helix transcriptional regulator [Oscillospiraceae bacterium]|nr:helix-turn-helix transcriptional regulator [Oscillospiraceae bacterium]
MNKAYEKQIGEKIKLLREERKLTQEEVAARLQVLGCDVTRSALAKIEVGQRHIYPDEIKRLAEIFKVSCDDILM